MIKKKETSMYNTAVFIMALLSSLVPRYISTFKIPLGINISFYTIAVVLAFLVYLRKLHVYNKIECLFIIIWFIYIALSIFRAEIYGVWAYYFVWSLTSVLFAQILYLNNDDRIYKNIIDGLLVGLLIHLIIGLYEITAHRYLFEVSIVDDRDYYGKVPVSIFINPNDYVTYIITVFPFLLLRMAQAKKIFKQGLLAGINMLCFYMIVRSGSRSAFYTMILLGIAIVWLIYKKSFINKLFIFCLITSGIAIFLLVPVIRQSLLSAFNNNRIDTGHTDHTRYNLIMNGLYFLKKTKGMGVGPGNLKLWLRERSIYPIRVEYMHNWYVELLVTFGIPFFILYLIFHLGIVIKLIKRFDINDSIWNMNNAMLVSFVSFSVVSIASSSNVYSEWIWMYLVFISTYVLQMRKKKSGELALQYS